MSPKLSTKHAQRPALCGECLMQLKQPTKEAYIEHKHYECKYHGVRVWVHDERGNPAVEIRPIGG